MCFSKNGAMVHLPRRLFIYFIFHLLGGECVRAAIKYQMRHCESEDMLLNEMELAKENRTEHENSK